MLFYIFANHEEMQIKKFEETKKKMEKEAKKDDGDEKSNTGTSVRRRTREPDYKKKLVCIKSVYSRASRNQNFTE